MAPFDEDVNQKIETWSERTRKAFGYLLLFVYLTFRINSESLPPAVSYWAQWQSVKLIAGVGCVITLSLYVMSEVSVQRLTGNIWANPLWSRKVRHFAPLLIGVAVFELIILGARMMGR